MKTISPNDLRKMLEQGLQELLDVLPEGNDIGLEIPPDVSDDPCVSFEAQTGLEILTIFVRTVSALRAHHPTEVVRRIMMKEGGARAILWGETDYLAQKYLD